MKSIFSKYLSVSRLLNSINSSSTTLLFLLLGKWTIVILTIFINIKLLQSIEELDVINEEKVVLTKKSQDVLEKKDILTTIDLILKKYTKKSE
ncbi:hypothetical protein ACIB15232_a0211 (plasmid) [Aliarcobacter cibarius]|uniref:hypothetical protein n=1 Tax=Aliarcobacter cibarius TaxID=255507 RepID=UPI001247AD0F|nr:hypothetical protein [Aliarcobacter cibarius]QEZ90370.1 hypothetical protein ACIB15232_a0211 [Aliarcobacter cibarius]